MEDIIKRICLRTVNGNSYLILESNNDEEANKAIELFENSIGTEDTSFKVQVFDYSEDTKNIERYRNIDMKRDYFSNARDYYMRDNGMLNNSDLNNTIAIFKNMDKFILDNSTDKEKMRRLKEFLVGTNFIREANYDFKSVIYVMPSWLINFIYRYCPDWKSQCGGIYQLPSSEKFDYDGFYRDPDWFDEKFYKTGLKPISMWGYAIVEQNPSKREGFEH